MEKGSGVGLNSGGKPLKSILKKSNSFPINKVDDVVAPIAAAGVVIDGKYKAETDFESPIRSAKKDDEVMEDVGNYANDDIAAGVNNPQTESEIMSSISDVNQPMGSNVGESPKVADGSTYVTANAGTKPANGVDSYTKHAGTTPSGTEHEDGKNGSNEVRYDGQDNLDTPHMEPKSFASLLKPSQGTKRVSFRSFINEVRVENHDTVPLRLLWNESLTVDTRFGLGALGGIVASDVACSLNKSSNEDWCWAVLEGDKWVGVRSFGVGPGVELIC
ncbi:hypothetical protein Tco_1050996 [Tanacetum coccineum]